MPPRKAWHPRSLAFIMAASQLEVVVFPWVPATARVGFPSVMRPSISALLIGTMSAPRKCRYSGMDCGIAGVQTTVNASRRV